MNKNNLKKEQRKYLRSIKNSLPIAYRKRAKLMKQFSQGVSEYCAEYKPVTMDALYSEFGTTEEVTASMLSEIPPEQIIKESKRKKYCTYIIITILTGVLALTIGRIVYFNYKILPHLPYTIEIETEESEPKELPNGWEGVKR